MVILSVNDMFVRNGGEVRRNVLYCTFFWMYITFGFKDGRII